jgi:hypothetical protein
MFNILLSLFVSSTAINDSSTITIDYGEVEMIWVPDNWNGPIVAAPFDDNIFN